MEDLLRRITFNKDVLCGKPIIRGLRISVDAVLELLAKGATEQEILGLQSGKPLGRPNYCVSSRSKTLDQLANKKAKRCYHLISAPCAVAKWSKKTLRNFCVVESTLRY